GGFAAVLSVRLVQDVVSAGVVASQFNCKAFQGGVCGSAADKYAVLDPVRIAAAGEMRHVTQPETGRLGERDLKAIDGLVLVACAGILVRADGDVPDAFD